MHSVMMKTQGRWQVNEMKQVQYGDQRFDRRIYKHKGGAATNTQK
jgi:hypothetical protein